jgi:uncharacterized MAPEG superfamily protein
MTFALLWLALTLLLAMVYIFAAAAARTAKFGGQWNAGARDGDMGDPGVLAGRLARAQANLFETLPLMIGAVLIAHVANADPGLTTLGTQLYFFSRLAYLPLYAMGVPYLRTVAWMVGLFGFFAVLYAVFNAGAA